MALGERLKWARTQIGMKQKELALTAGIGQGTLSKLEREDAEHSSFAPQFADALGCDLYWLTTGKGEPWPKPASKQRQDILDYVLNAPEDELDDFKAAIEMLNKIRK